MGEVGGEKEKWVSAQKDEVLCQLRRIACSRTEEQYLIAIGQLQNSEIWKANPNLRKWF